MKKLTTFIIFFLIIIFGIIYFTYGKDFLELLDEKRVYSVKNAVETAMDNLEECKFFGGGIITYNNQKVIFLDYNNNTKWKNEDAEFSSQIFTAGEYIFRKTGSTIQVTDKNNERYVIAEIDGQIINVSRENNKTYIIIKNSAGKNSLYIINENNEIAVDNKVFSDIITGVSISDKSEGYSIMTLKLESGKTVNSVYFNLMDDVELWKTEISNEILIKIKIVNNNVVVIGTKNIYYYNLNGKLMWKNGIYNEILDYEINKENQKIYVLYKKNDGCELISYNLEGKVKELMETPGGAQKLKVYGNKVFVYNENRIYLIHGTKTDKVYENNENKIVDFIFSGNDIFILFKDKLIKGQIK